MSQWSYCNDHVATTISQKTLSQWQCRNGHIATTISKPPYCNHDESRMRHKPHYRPMIVNRKKAKPKIKLILVTFHLSILSHDERIGRSAKTFVYGSYSYSRTACFILLLFNRRPSYGELQTLYCEPPAGNFNNINVIRFVASCPADLVTDPMTDLVRKLNHRSDPCESFLTVSCRTYLPNKFFNWTF